MLAVAREDVVVGFQCPGRPDLCGLLARHRRPEAEFALALQRDRLVVEPADDDQVAVEVAESGGSDIGDQSAVSGVVDALPVGLDQLDRVGRGCNHRVTSWVLSG